MCTLTIFMEVRMSNPATKEEKGWSITRLLIALALIVFISQVYSSISPQSLIYLILAFLGIGSLVASFLIHTESVVLALMLFIAAIMCFLVCYSGAIQ